MIPTGSQDGCGWKGPWRLQPSAQARTPTAGCPGPHILIFLSTSVLLCSHLFKSYSPFLNMENNPIIYLFIKFRRFYEHSLLLLQKFDLPSGLSRGLTWYREMKIKLLTPQFQVASTQWLNVETRQFRQVSVSLSKKQLASWKLCWGELLLGIFFPPYSNKNKRGEPLTLI